MSRSVLGGVVVGGQSNFVEGPGGGRGFAAVILGGLGNRTDEFAATIGGGNNNTAEGQESSIAGGSENKTIGRYSSILGGRNKTVTESWGIFPE